MTERRQVDDSGRFIMFQLRQQQIGEQEVTQVVGSHLKFEAIGSFGVRAHHHTYKFEKKNYGHMH